MRTWLLLLPVLAVGACSSLPHDGPSVGAVEHGARATSSANYAFVDLDYRTAVAVSASPPPPLRGLAAAGSDAPNDRIGEGDVLAVSVYEPGGSVIFASSSSLAGGDTGRISGGTTEDLPHLTVASDGAVMIPYAGRVRVAGLTVVEAAREIQRDLRGKLVDPQVDVNLIGNAANTVTIVGEVRNAGRIPLAPNNERLLDVIAAAGGPTRAAADVTVSIVRGDTTVSTSLAALLRDETQDVRLAPHDQVRLFYTPRKFSTFGALGRVSEQPIEDERLNLAEAISRSGGLDTNSANASGVLLFRFERPEVARSLGVNQAPTPKGVPIVYRLNLLTPDGYFVADNFEVQTGDLIYVPRSDETELKKFLELVSLVSSITYNISAAPVTIH